MFFSSVNLLKFLEARKNAKAYSCVSSLIEPNFLLKLEKSVRTLILRFITDFFFLSIFQFLSTIFAWQCSVDCAGSQCRGSSKGVCRVDRERSEPFLFLFVTIHQHNKFQICVFDFM